jgi:hypothetical protein
MFNHWAAKSCRASWARASFSSRRAWASIWSGVCNSLRPAASNSAWSGIDAHRKYDRREAISYELKRAKLPSRWGGPDSSQR